MKSKTKLIALASLLTISALAFTGCGHWYKHKSPEQKAEWMVEEIQEELELNEAQLAKLNKLKDVALAARKSLKDDHQTHHQQITKLLSEPTLDQTKLQAMVDNKLQFFTSQSPVFIAALADFYDSLTTEQQQEVREKWNKKSERYKHHHWH